MNYDRAEILESLERQLRRVPGRSLPREEAEAIYKEFEGVFPRYTYLER